jgi:predicted nicotinamide N-methyase
MLEAAPLADRFHLVAASLRIGGRDYEFLKPRSADELISEEDFNRDERIPYWADIWPSARVLADRLATLEGHGGRLLELGCGLGVPSMVASAAGLEVLATDYYDDALEFVRLNAERNGVASPQTRMVDWRAFPADLGTFDWVVAADVLYERPYSALVAGAIARTLKPGGRAWLTDPGRNIASGFPEVCRDHGLNVVSHERIVFRESSPEVPIDLYEIRH